MKFLKTRSGISTLTLLALFSFDKFSLSNFSLNFISNFGTTRRPTGDGLVSAAMASFFLGAPFLPSLTAFPVVPDAASSLSLVSTLSSLKIKLQLIIL